MLIETSIRKKFRAGKKLIGFIKKIILDQQSINDLHVKQSQYYFDELNTNSHVLNLTFVCSFMIYNFTIQKS